MLRIKSSACVMTATMASPVNIGNHLKTGVLGYADDAALMSGSTQKMSERLSLSSIFLGSREDCICISALAKQNTCTLNGDQN